MKRERIYISIPISGHDLEKVKEKARNIREWVLWDEFGLDRGWHRPDVITPFDVCPEPDKPYSYYMGRILKPCWSAMLSICARGGRTPRVAWQSSRRQEFTVKK